MGSSGESVIMDMSNSERMLVLAALSEFRVGAKGRNFDHQISSLMLEIKKKMRQHTRHQLERRINNGPEKKATNRLSSVRF